MTKFNVGDTVRINDDYRSVLIGMVGVIIEDDTYEPRFRVRVENGTTTWKHSNNIGLIKDTSARLTEAEAEITTLKAKVAALEKAQKPAKFPPFKPMPSVTIDTKGLSELLSERIGRFARTDLQTPNRRRADVIKRAQAFVADLLTEIDGDDGWMETVIPTYKDLGRIRVEFVINNDKRTVVALGRLGNIPEDNTAYAKGIAKCAPDDVFNVDIGKAIALGRALGVDIPKEFTDAPKPTEVVVGMVIDAKEDTVYSTNPYEVTSINRDKLYNHPYAYLPREAAVILEDTDAVYE